MRDFYNDGAGIFNIGNSRELGAGHLWGGCSPMFISQGELHEGLIKRKKNRRQTRASPPPIYNFSPSLVLCTKKFRSQRPCHFKQSSS